MKPAVLGALGVFLLSNLVGAADFDSLVEEYNKVKGQVGGGGGRGGFRRGRRGGGRQGDPEATAARILDEIGQLGSDRALKFLLDQLEGAPSSLATLSARAALKSSHPLCPNVVFTWVGKKPPRVSIAILNAVDPQEDGGRNFWRRRQQPRRAVEVDWPKVERELLQASRAAKDGEVKLRLVPVVAKLAGAAAARGILQASASQGRPGPEAEELHRRAVEALVTVGDRPEVRAWLSEEALAVAKSNPGMLAVVAEAGGRLRIAELRGSMEELVSHRRAGVALAAIEGLGYLKGPLSEKTVEVIGRRLKRASSNVDRGRILDSLARNGSPGALDLVLESAQKGDLATRAIAVSSLALVDRDPEVVQGLLAALDDSAVEVRSNALRALKSGERAREKVVIPALIDYLESETVDRLKADTLRLLVDLTGYNIGFVAADWKKWWEMAAEDFDFSKVKESKTRVVTESYFGIEVASTRLAFLLDVSRSMESSGRRRGPGPGRKSKLELLKEELTRLLKKLPDEAQVNLITFDSSVRPWSDKLQPLSRGGRERAIQFVQGLKPGNHTNVFDSLETALEDRRVDTIYLLTDGQPTTGRFTDTPGILRGVEELNRVRGVTIHCIAFGEESDLLKRLAEENGGIYRFVEPQSPAQPNS